MACEGENKEDLRQTVKINATLVYEYSLEGAWSGVDKFKAQYGFSFHCEGAECDKAADYLGYKAKSCMIYNVIFGEK